MNLTWYAVNNSVTLEDLSDLESLGITVATRSRRPVHVYREPESGRMLAELGSVIVWRDGRVRITPRADCPDKGVVVLARTALDCAERDLHRRDSWRYYRATATQTGQWSAVIAAWVPDDTSLFEAQAAALRPAAVRGARATADSIHTRA